MIDAFGTWRPDFPGQSPYQYPAFMRMYGQPQEQKQEQETRMEVVPVNTETDVDKMYVPAGGAKIAMARNDTFFAVKTVSMSGKPGIVYFDRRPEPPPAPAFDPTEYVRKDEINAFVEAALATRACWPTERGISNEPV